jgi:1-acyl-sn-glycerol-3-phosphate acyltransferase
VVSFFLHLSQALLMAAFYLPWLPDEGRRQLIQRWCKQVLPILRIRVVSSAVFPSQPVMLVANHISWVDAWAINSLHPVRFVAKSDVRDYPIVGWLTKQCGVVYIQRARRRDTARVSGEAAKVLKQGDCLCVFPEGTTTDGSYILPFKSSLLQAAVDTGVDIVPVALRYLSADGKPNTDVAFIGEMNLWQSLLIILAHDEILTEITFLEAISTRQDRQSLAQSAQEQIVRKLNLPQRTQPEIPDDLAGELQ